MSSDVSCTVAVPAYNEAQNIAALLRSLEDEQSIRDIIVYDDGSTDGTAEIVAAEAERDSRIRLIRGRGRGGQITGWISAAKVARTDTIVFIDADSLPAPGAIATLARDVRSSVIASGRISPSSGGSAGMFSAEVIHELRLGPAYAMAVIGRFFAVQKAWFLDNCTRVDIIANDSWLACLAVRAGKPVRYVPNAVVRYVAPSGSKDFGAQRIRADAGYAQLKRMGLLNERGLPGRRATIAALLRASLRRPSCLPAWLVLQMRARSSQAHVVPSGAHAGIWEPQTSTKTGAACALP